MGSKKTVVLDGGIEPPQAQCLADFPVTLAYTSILKSLSVAG